MTELLERYRSLIARDGETFPITLGEGGTPLIHARRLAAEIGLGELHLKFEGTNPTGSFKDRGMVLAVNRAVAAGARAVVCGRDYLTPDDLVAVEATTNTWAVVRLLSSAIGTRVLMTFALSFG